MHIRDAVLLKSPLGFKNTDGLKALTINYLLFQFAVGMVGAFGVIFIFQFGNSLSEGLAYVVGYLVLQRLLVAVAIAPAGHAISRLGYRWMMLAGVVALSIKLYLLSLSSVDNTLPLFLSTLFGAISISTYYLSYHALFLDDNDDAKIGEQIGMLDTLGRLATVIAPFVAGIMIEVYGFSTMFMTATVLMVLSALPLLTMKTHTRHKSSFSLKSVWEFINKRPRIMGSHYAWDITVGIQAAFWMILLFLAINSYTVYGLIGSITMLASAVSLYVAGRLYDERQHKRLFVGSSVVVSLTWIGRFFSTTILGFIVSDVFNRLFSPLWWMKIRRQELVEGEKVDSLVFGAAHEYVVTAAFLTAFLLCYVLLILSNGNWGLLAIPAVGATILATWLVRDK